MIGYRISQADLEAQIALRFPRWLAKAATRTAKLILDGRFNETSSIWSEIKPLYMELQGGSKCAYCERKLESDAHGRGEQDIEHFRPKGRVTVWVSSDTTPANPVTIMPVPSDTLGYFWLAYHPFNYCAACKPCNSALKSDKFPVTGTYDFTVRRTPMDLLSEKPLLIYPFGDFDVDPTKLIGFVGVSPFAIATSGLDRARGLTTIDFFRLDSAEERSNLLLERARVIIALHPQLKVLKGRSSAATKAMAQKIVTSFKSPKAPHTNCTVSFCDLFQKKRKVADAIFEKAVEFVLSKS